MRPALLITSLAVCLASPALARTWEITVDGLGDAPSIQAGIDSSAAGDSVLVGPGTYQENIDYNGKDIVLKSESGPDVTVLDGSLGNDSVVKFHSAETRAAILEGFTITGGKGTRNFGSPEGGGIVCLNASPVVRNNRIVDNSSPLDYGVGAGMAVGSGLVVFPRANPLVEENLFETNSASGNGGGLSINNAEATVRNNVFRYNSCTADGGGVWGLFNVGTVTLIGNQFWSNTAGDHGGGVHLGNAGLADAALIMGNLFVRNHALGRLVGGDDTGSGSGIYCQGMVGMLANNTLVGNQGLGGTLELKNVPDNLEVRGNLMAFNDGGAITCRLGVQSNLGPNLLWQNVPEDIDSECPGDWSNVQIVRDPLFCTPEVDDYTVAYNSPALTGEQVMGAFSEPGCGATPVRPTTWGRLKSRYQ